MKKFLSLALMIVLILSLTLTSCGKKKVKAIQIDEGFKYEYELNEKPDFSGVKATIIYNDDTTKQVSGSELTFGNLDTSTAGKKQLEVSYEGFTTTYDVTVKTKSVAAEKELLSIRYLDGIPENVYVGDIINFNNVTILAEYSDGSNETKSVASSSAIKHNGAEITTDTAGSKTLTLSFMGKSCEYVINVQAIVVVSLKVTAANLNVPEGMEFDKNSLKVNKVFNNGEEIAVNVDELTVTQNGNVVTIQLGDVSTTLNLDVQDPVVTSLVLNTASFKNKILVGDTPNTSAINITGNLSNGLSENVPLTDVSFSAVDTSVAGTKTITVTYTKDSSVTASFDVTVLSIKSIAINASSISTRIPAGEAFDYNNIQIIITATDDTTFYRGVADGVTVDASKLDVNTYGTYNITASYRGVTSAELTLTVHDPDISYNIISVALPESITSQETYQKDFMVQGNPYVVGDDNPFKLKLNLTILNDNNQIVEDYDSYKSYFEIWKDGAVLTTAEYEQYVDAIDAANNSIDFSSSAIGLTFTIKTRPADGIEEDDYASMTRELTVKIVDAINIHEAWELNYLSNYHDFSIPGESRSIPQIALAFLKTKTEIDAIPSIAGAVLHNNLEVTTSDIPSEYLLSSTGRFYDFLSVFSHATDKNNPTFTFYGNYFYIQSAGLPEVCTSEDAGGNQDDKVSSAQLFRFSCTELNATDFDINNYKTRFENIYFRDDNAARDEEQIEARANRGLIAMKVQFQTIEAENSRIEAFYIGFFLDNDYTVASLNNSIITNCHQNNIYSYNKNPLSGDDTYPAENYSPITLSITNSKITKCGGPVILNQTEHPELNKNSKSGALVTIDKATEIWSWVTGTESWFKAVGAQSTATQLSGLGLLLAQQMPKTFISTTNENDKTHPDGMPFMNMIMVNLVAGTDFNSVINFTGDLDGTFTKGDIKYLDMTDNVALDGVHGYGSQTVATQWATQASAGKAPVIINTHTDGTIVIDAETSTATPAGNTAGLADGDMVAIYYGCFGFVFGYQAYNN